MRRSTSRPAKTGHPNKPSRPDHFIGIRIRSPEALAEIQSQVIKRSPSIAGYMEEVVKAHVTLGVLRLDTPEKVAESVARFKSAMSNLRDRELFPDGFRIAFDSFESFGTRVLFLKPTEACIAQLREIRSRLFDDHMSMYATEARLEYNPHLTVAKQTRWLSKRRETTVAPRMPEDKRIFDDIDVNVDVTVTKVELVRMRGEKEADGYYKIVASEPLCGPDDPTSVSRPTSDPGLAATQGPSCM